MSYLVCDNCEGYYELQPGQKAEDFDLTCECGGKLKHKETIKRDNHAEDFKKTSNIVKRFMGVILGTIVIIVVSSLFNVEIVLFGVLHSASPLTFFYLLTLIFAGVLIVFVARGDYKECIINCLAVGLIGGALASILNGYIPSSFGFMVILMSIFFSVMGGFIAVVMIKLKK